MAKMTVLSALYERFVQQVGLAVLIVSILASYISHDQVVLQAILPFYHNSLNAYAR